MPLIPVLPARADKALVFKLKAFVKQHTRLSLVRHCFILITFWRRLWYFTEQMYSNIKWMLNEWLSFINAFLTVFLFSLFSVELEVFVLHQ